MATFPERVLALLNAAIVRIADAAFTVLGALPPLVGLVAVSVVVGAAMLAVVARASNQPAMTATKRDMHAGLFEIRLFNDDLRAIFRALAELLRANLRYLGLSLVPLLWMALPLVLLIAQLQAFYGYDGLPAGEPALVKAVLRTDAGEPPVLEVPGAVRLDTAAIRLAGSPEVLWRIVPTAAGSFTLTIRRGGETAAKSLEVSTGPARRSPWRGTPSIVNQLLYPSEPPLPEDSPVTAIAIDYPEPGIAILGWRVHWLILFVALSMATAFLLARRLGVTL